MSLSKAEMEHALATVFDAAIESLSQLSGGASQETWLIELVGGAKYILRRPPNGNSSALDQRTISPDVEVSILRSVVTKTPYIPKVKHLFSEGDALYPGYVMHFCAGETLASKILRDDKFASVRPNLAAQCGAAIAAIHTTPFEEIAGLATSDAATEIKRYASILKTHDHPHPVFELALHWLAQNVPQNRPKSLVHGDFRNGNIIVSETTGLSAVIDWELAHIGDPMEDLGWICVPSWRFGQIDKAVGGFGERQQLYDAYTAAGGTVCPKSAQFWEILGCLKWGIMCLIMYGIYDSGIDKSVERAAIGRRASETEIDLLLMLEEV
jgi:aminoglycoside phosphotransferase (APT) family kinase protein